MQTQSQSFSKESQKTEIENRLEEILLGLQDKDLSSTPTLKSMKKIIDLLRDYELSIERLEKFLDTFKSEDLQFLLTHQSAYKKLKAEVEEKERLQLVPSQAEEKIGLKTPEEIRKNLQEVNHCISGLLQSYEDSFRCKFSEVIAEANLSHPEVLLSPAEFRIFPFVRQVMGEKDVESLTPEQQNYVYLHAGLSSSLISWRFQQNRADFSPELDEKLLNSEVKGQIPKDIFASLIGFPVLFPMTSEKSSSLGALFSVIDLTDKALLLNLSLYFLNEEGKLKKLMTILNLPRTEPQKAEDFERLLRKNGCSAQDAKEITVKLLYILAHRCAQSEAEKAPIELRIQHHKKRFPRAMADNKVRPILLDSGFESKTAQKLEEGLEGFTPEETVVLQFASSPRASALA